LGLDQPLWKQYFFYLNDLSPLSLHSESGSSYTSLQSGKYEGVKLFSMGNSVVILKFPYLRTSFQKQGKTVTDIIAETLPNTVVLAVSAITFAIVIGILLGIWSALVKDSWIDRALLVVTSFGMSIPSFFSAIIVAYIFAYLLHDLTGFSM